MTAWVVLGTGGHARSVTDVVARLGDRVVAFSGALEGWASPVVGSDDEALETAKRAAASVVVAIGDAARRAELVRRVSASGADLTPLVASTATVSDSAQLGPGCQVLEHAHVGPGATLGPGVIVNTGAVVEHDVTVGDGSHIAPGAVLLGAVVVGRLTLVGARATLLPGVRTGDGVVVGAAALVREDVQAGRTAIGVPAHPTSRPRAR